MKDLFKEATFWELSNILWWISIIIVGTLGFIWYKLIKKFYYYIKNTYFLKFMISKKDIRWCEDVVKNFEIMFKTPEGIERCRNKNRLHYECYVYCKNRLNEEN